MKRQSLFIMTLALASLAGFSSAQDPKGTLVYLNFETATNGNIEPTTNGVEPTVFYSPSGTEVVNNPYANFLGLADIEVFAGKMRDSASVGPAIADTPAGIDQTNVTLGSKVLSTFGASLTEGLIIRGGNAGEGDAGFLGSYTLEVVWYTTDAAGTGNTAGVQSPIDNETLSGQEPHAVWIRTVGTTLQFWSNRGDSNGENFQVPSGIVANTAYHDAVVFEYNETNPESSVVKCYRNGALLGQFTLDTRVGGNAPESTLFASKSFGWRMYGVGMNITSLGQGDPRGVIGGIGSFAMSVGALEPSEFVLPGGNVLLPEFQTEVDSWMNYH